MHSRYHRSLLAVATLFQIIHRLIIHVLYTIKLCVNYCTYMIVFYIYQTSVYNCKLLDTLYIIISTNIAVSNITVYFIVLKKIAFYILYKTFHTMCK